MTPWFRRTLLCLALLCLLLSLTQPAQFNYLLPIVGSGSWLARPTEPATDADIVSVVRSMQPSARAGPPQSLVFSCTLTVVNTGPPGWGRHGPTGSDRGLGELPERRSSRQLQNQPTPSSTIRRENTGLNHQFPKFGVSQQPLARDCPSDSWLRSSPFSSNSVR